MPLQRQIVADLTKLLNTYNISECLELVSSIDVACGKWTGGPGHSIKILPMMKIMTT